MYVNTYHYHILITNNHHQRALFYHVWSLLCTSHSIWFSVVGGALLAYLLVRVVKVCTREQVAKDELRNVDLLLGVHLDGDALASVVH